jgi:hypothetical protein
MNGFLILLFATAVAPTGARARDTKIADAPMEAHAPSRIHLADVGPIRRSAIVVAIELREDTTGPTRRILADFKFTNRASRPKNLERWLLLKAPKLEMNLLRIRTADGTAIPYVGPQINRRILPTDYLTLLPGETRVAKDVDVTAAYQWPAAAGALSVEYRAISVYRNQMEILESESVNLDLH